MGSRFTASRVTTLNVQRTVRPINTPRHRLPVFLRQGRRNPVRYSMSRQLEVRKFRDNIIATDSEQLGSLGRRCPRRGFRWERHTDLSEYVWRINKSWLPYKPWSWRLATGFETIISFHRFQCHSHLAGLCTSGPLTISTIVAVLSVWLSRETASRTSSPILTSR